MEPLPGQSMFDERATRPWRPERVRSAPRWWVLPVVALVGGAVAYYYWQQLPNLATPELASPTERVHTPPAAAPEREVRHRIEVDETLPVLSLGESDAPMHEALASLVREQSLSDLFYPDQMIRRIVATIDNLPRHKAPVRLMPVKPAIGLFETTRSGTNTVISADNTRRYAPYLRLAQSVDTGMLMAAYIRFYPLFQRAYEELGFPNGYFNDRLVEAIDDLLDAPQVSGPIEVVQPKVLYEFGDPSLEARSAGQKMMIRMGNENATRVRAKLREIRYEVTRVRSILR